MTESKAKQVIRQLLEAFKEQGAYLDGYRFVEHNAEHSAVASKDVRAERESDLAGCGRKDVQWTINPDDED